EGCRRAERRRTRQQDHNAAAQSAGRLNFIARRKIPVSCLKDMVAADLNHLPVQDEYAARLGAGLRPEVGDGVVAQNQVLHVGYADSCVAEGGTLAKRAQRPEYRGGDGIRADAQVFDADDFLVLHQIEKAYRTDPAQTAIADAVSVDLNIDQLAGGHNLFARLPGPTAWHVQGDSRITRTFFDDRHSFNMAAIVAVGIEDRQAAKRDAVAPCLVDLVLHNEHVAGRAGDLDAARVD